MNRAFALIFAAAATTGCGDDLPPRALSAGEVLDRLRQLPNVTVTEQATENTEFHYFVLRFTQPLDHGNPALGTFEQRVSLLHRSDLATAPLVVQIAGYADNNRDRPVELTRLLRGNQAAIEHRYFGESRPEPVAWSKLTIEQAAADQHAVIDALKTIYQGAVLTTGGSKGGMAAVFHRRFYPDDVDGTVAYVAPISHGVPDLRYPAFVDTIGSASCRAALRNIAIYLLANQRSALYARAAAEPGRSYQRIKLGAAVESAVVNLEWMFWQFFGAGECDRVPSIQLDANAQRIDAGAVSDAELFAFLDEVSPVSDSEDRKIGFFEPYYYQAFSQLGFPDCGAGYLAPYVHYDDAEYRGWLPTPNPPYDPGAMEDIDAFVQRAGHRLVFVYGEWDPWSAGRFSLGGATESVIVTQPRGTHAAQISGLPHSDKQLVFGKLEAWTGVRPTWPIVTAARTDGAAMADDASDTDVRRSRPRMPPAMVRALRARK